MKNKFLFCVIMVVRNEQKYIANAMRSVLRRADVFIFLVDDNSCDGTFDEIRSVANEYRDQIYFEKNCGVGKVEAYRSIRSLPECNFYLFLDGDDLFSNDWVNFSPDVKEQALYYQDINLLFSDNEIERMTHPRIDKAVPRELIKSLVLLPKVSWIVPGALIYEYLDIPEGVEFEDIWFSLISYSGPLRITKVDAVWYLYRQHNHQVFGSLAKGGDEVVAFRYGRILRSLDAIIRHKPDLAHLLEQPASRYRTLASMSITKILYFLGPKEALLHILKIHTPGLLKTLKKYIRESG